MFSLPRINRWIVVGLLASTLVALAAPAFADHRRYRGVQAAPQRVYVRDRSSSVGPVLAGLVGGFILGAAVTSNAHPTVVHEQRYYEPDYRYYDPYGDNWYDSLDECRFDSRGPQVVFVIDVHSGYRVRELQYRYGRWNRCGDGYFASWAGSRGYRYNDRRWRNGDGDRWDNGRRYKSDRDDRRYRGHDRGDD